MTVVVDASVALKWVLPEPGSDLAIDLLTSSRLTAPVIWIAEAGNALWRHVLRKEITRSEALARLGRLRSVPVDAVALDEDIDAALRLAADLGHPIYDCLYLALSIRLETHVVTADRRFVALAEHRADLAGRIRPLA